MAVSGQRKSGGTKKHTRNKEKCAAYARRRTRFKHKAARVLQSNGKEAYAAYLRGPLHALRYRRRHAS